MTKAQPIVGTDSRYWFPHSCENLRCGRDVRGPDIHCEKCKAEIESRRARGISKPQFRSGYSAVGATR